MECTAPVGFVSLEKLTGENLFYLRGKFTVKGLCGGFIHKVALRRCIFSGNTIQITGDQFPAEEEGTVCAIRQSVIPDAIAAGIPEAALSIELDVALKTDCSAAEKCRLLHRMIQKNLPVSFALQLRADADWSHGHDGDFSAIVCMNDRMHKHILTNQVAILFHDEVQIRHESRIISQLMQHIVLQTAGTVDVPECFPDKVFHFAVFIFSFQTNTVVIFIH